MNPEKQVLALFRDESLTAAAVEALVKTSWKVKDVHSPIRSDRLLKALKVKKSTVGYFTLAGGIIGFFGGIGLAMYTGLQWSLIVSGKPVVAWIPYIIVGFEFTVLFAVLGNIVGLVTQTRLPEYRGMRTYDPVCSGEHYGILASCPEGEQQALIAFLREKGGEAKML